MSTKLYWHSLSHSGDTGNDEATRGGPVDTPVTKETKKQALENTHNGNEINKEADRFPSTFSPIEINEKHRPEISPWRQI